MFLEESLENQEDVSKDESPAPVKEPPFHSYAEQFLKVKMAQAKKQVKLSDSPPEFGTPLRAFDDHSPEELAMIYKEKLRV